MYNLYISIYAPAWGATLRGGLKTDAGRFQSTHPRGVRLFVACRFSAAQYFNPRTRVGCDNYFRENCYYPALISIHAPAWGATERDDLRDEISDIFQSTHPRGVRLSTLQHARVLLHFNPRTRVGCDAGIVRRRSLDNLFQSTHPRGVRLHCHTHRCTAARFQSTHPRGVRHATQWFSLTDEQISIHAPAWGATIMYRTFYPLLEISIHAPAWGATSPCRVHAVPNRISIHAPAWGATDRALR